MDKIALKRLKKYKKLTNQSNSSKSYQDGGTPKRLKTVPRNVSKEEIQARTREWEAKKPYELWETPASTYAVPEPLPLKRVWKYEGKYIKSVPNKAGKFVGDVQEISKREYDQFKYNVITPEKSGAESKVFYGKGGLAWKQITKDEQPGGINKRKVTQPIPFQKPSKKGIKKYDFGGTVGDVFKGAADYSLGWFGLSDVVEEDDYKTKGGKKAGEFLEKVAPIQSAVGSTALNVAGSMGYGIPGQGTMLYGATGAINQQLESPEETPIQQPTPYIQPRPSYFNMGGKINVEGGEYELYGGSNGIKTKFVGPSHKNGGITYMPKPDMMGNSGVIIPKNIKLQGGQDRRWTTESILRNQQNREQKELFKHGGLIPFDSFHRILPPESTSNQPAWENIGQDPFVHDPAAFKSRPKEFGKGGRALLKFNPKSKGRGYAGGGLTRKEDYGSKSKPYPMVAENDFAGPHRSYPIHSQGDVSDALSLAGLHNGPVANIKRIAKRKGFSIPSKKHGGNIDMAPYHNLPQEEYDIMYNQMYSNFAKGGKNWIAGAINPAHKGYCTPMTKATCTPHRKAFAIRAKAHFKEQGGYTIPKYTHGGLDFSNTIMDPKQRQGSPYDFDGSYNSDLLGGNPEFENLSSPYGAANPWITPQMKVNSSTPSTQQPFSMSPQNTQGLGFTNTMTSKNPSVWGQSNANPISPQGQGFDWSGVGSQVATWAPVAYNLMGAFSKPAVEQPIYNPYDKQVQDIMSKRKISLDPLRRDLYAQEKIGAQPLGAESQGGYLSRRTQLTANTQRALGQLGLQQQQMNLDYDADFANTLMRQGMDAATALRMARRQTIQNMANRQQFLPATLEQTAAIAGKSQEDKWKQGYMKDFFTNLKFDKNTNSWSYSGGYPS